MRYRLLVLFLALGLLSPTAVATEKARGRMVSAPYAGSAGVVVGNSYYTYKLRDEDPWRVRFQAKPRERYVVVSVRDRVSDGVPFSIGLDIGNDGEWDGSMEYCGQTPGRIFVGKQTEVWVEVYSGTCFGENAPFRPTTSGVVEAVFTR